MPVIIFICLFPYIFGRHIPKFIQEIYDIGKQNEKFKQIFDQLNESIIILNKEDDSISYVNNYFYQ